MQNATRRAAEQAAGVEQLLEQTKTAVADSANIGGNLTALGERAAKAQTKIAQLAEASETFTRTFAELNRVLQDATKRAAEHADKPKPSNRSNLMVFRPSLTPPRKS